MTLWYAPHSVPAGGAYLCSKDPLPKELLHLALNPLSLATLSPGATTYWIDTPEAVVALATVLRQQKEFGGHALQKRGLPFSLILGFDVESRPSFQAGQRNRPSILQVQPQMACTLPSTHCEFSYRRSLLSHWWICTSPRS